MTFYAGVLATIGLLAVVLTGNGGGKGRIQFAWSSMLFLTVLAATRDFHVGADTEQYYRYFPILGRLDWSQRDLYRFEPGYFAANKAMYALTQDPQWFIAATSAAIFLPVAWHFARYSQSIVLSVILFVSTQAYAMQLSALRQSLATAIVLMFLPQLVKGRWAIYLGAVAVAAQFHTSAYVLALLVFLRLRPFRWFTPVYYLLFGVLMLGFSARLLQFIGAGDERYSVYSEKLDIESGKLGVGLTLIFFVVVLAAPLAIRGVSAGLDRARSDESLQMHAAWLTVSFLLLALGSNAFLRFSYYFLPFVCVAVPSALAMISDERTRMLARYVVVTGAVSYCAIIVSVRPEWTSVTPFSFFWN